MSSSLYTVEDMPYRDLGSKEEQNEDNLQHDEQKELKRTTVRGISWSLDHDLSNDGLSSNERIVKIMSRNNSELLSKWIDAVRMKTGKADIARTILKEFHECGATHRQKSDDMVKGLSSFFRRYETFKEKVELQTSGPSIRYSPSGELEFANVSSFLQVYLEKNFPYYLDLTKAFDTLYRLRPELRDSNEVPEVQPASTQTKSQHPSTQPKPQPKVEPADTSDDEESSVEEIQKIYVDKKKRKVKRTISETKWNNDEVKLKRMKEEAEIRRYEAETKRIEFETHEKVLALYAKYNEPRFLGTEESKAAEYVFKTTFPALYSHDNHNSSESEVDELEE